MPKGPFLEYLDQRSVGRMPFIFWSSLLALLPQTFLYTAAT